MTFAEAKTRILEDAFPDGPPEHLQTWLGRAVQSALIEIQRDVPCFQYGHVDVTPACQLFWHSGAAVVTPPRGRIFRAYTVDPTADPNWAQPTILRPTTLSYLRRWQARWRSAWSWTNEFDAPNSGVSYGLGFDKITSTSDAAAGRAEVGLYALDKSLNQLWIAPWLQSSESLVIEWSGIKREWGEADEVPDSSDFLRLARLFVELEFGRKFATADLAIREAAYREARADMMATCAHERQLHGEPGSADEAAATYWSAYVPETTTTTTTDSDDTVICFVGDTVNAGTDVAAALPDGANLVLLGNNKSPGGDADTDMAPFADFSTKAVLGVNEMDDGTLGADVRAFCSNPGNGRYYSVTYGPVTVFVVNSGLDSSDDLQEPDGNFDGSVQYQHVLSAVLRNTSPWKVLCVHHPLFTSASSAYPGLDAVRWANRMPVHAIISGNARAYERLSILNRTNFTVGTGGAELDEWADDEYPGSAEKALEFGYLKLSANCDTATFEFLDLDGNVLDTLELDTPGEPYVTPSNTPMDPRITTQPTGASVVVGLPYELSVVAAGTATLQYQWQEDGSNMPSEHASTLSLTVSESHTYRCLVTNSVGGVMSKAVQVNAIVGSISVVANLSTFRAGHYPSAAAINLGSDGNGQAGYFVPGGTGSDDGVNEIIDADGRHFVRWRFV